jgi:mRNA interferase RelE/StbE
MDTPKRATVYFEGAVHQALRLKAAATDRSITDMVNEAVRVALAEVAEDLAAFDERKGEQSIRQRIVARILALADEPRPVGCEKLGGVEGKYHVRQGQFRIVYAIDDASLTVEVVKVGHRREVYRACR